MKFNIRLPTEDDDLDNLHAFDFTKMSAVNTCPTWGIIRYGYHKVFNTTSRAMALEAGSALHEVFAGARAFDTLTYSAKAYPDIKPTDIRNLVEDRLKQMFGTERSNSFLNEFDSTEDERTRILRAGLSILNTGAFYDDPQDKRRTLSNLEEAAIAYLDRYEFGKNVPYIRGDYLGIETPINLIVEYETDDGINRTIRFVGRIDGVHCHRNDPNIPYVEENKTASRLGDAWEQSFEMSHQVTGYMAAASTILNTQLSMARIRGLCIPQPRVYDTNGVSTVTVFRKSHQFTEWAKWVVHTVEMFLQHYDDPTNAPKYTHSCNRYFRPCSYIPLCTAPPEERVEIFNEMFDDEWSPLHEKAGD
jgi:hypothetical protein